MNNKQLLLDYWKRAGIITDERLFKAFKSAPRELFIPENLKEEAYDDMPLPISNMQTISQPTTVMLMLQALEIREGQKILEIGTGSGWNAALISFLVGKKGRLITTEVVKELVNFSKNNLKKLKIKNVEVIYSDGSAGYEEEAPYDRLIATCACPKIPNQWIEQLKEGGIIVAPVGNTYGQSMIKALKTKKGLVEENLGEFVFVPMKGKEGF